MAYSGLLLAGALAASIDVADKLATPVAVGWVDAEVDPAACSQSIPACEPTTGVPALDGNASPVRVVLQVQSLRSPDRLRLEDLEVRTIVTPLGASDPVPMTCDACFEAKPGGSIVFWLAPVEGIWKAGDYFVTVGLANRGSLAPALLRIPIGFPPRSNAPPKALMSIVPPSSQGVGKPVLFDGTASLDPELDPITMYRWTITATDPDPGVPNPMVAEGPTESVLQRTFSNPGTLTVVLEVSDHPRARELFDAGLPVPYSSLKAAATYAIRPYSCEDNLPPEARIAGDSIRLVGVTGQTFNVLLDGTLSSDPELLPIQDFVWNCGSNRAPVEQPPDGSRAICQYVVSTTSHTYTASLRVKDGGNGEFDPVSGDYRCAKVSAPDTIEVVVVNATAP